MVSITHATCSSPMAGMSQSGGRGILLTDIWMTVWMNTVRVSYLKCWLLSSLNISLTQALSLIVELYVYYIGISSFHLVFPYVCMIIKYCVHYDLILQGTPSLH